MKAGLGKSFWIYFVIMFSSAFVDNILKNAIIVFALFNNVGLWGLSPEALAPVAAGIFILPFLLFSATAGLLCDQKDKKYIVIICKALELMIGVLVIYYFPKQEFAPLMGCLFILGVHSTLFGPAKYSMIKNLVTQDNFILATAWVEAGTFISILLGTIGGAVLASNHTLDNYGVGIVMASLSSFAFILSFFLPNFAKNNINKINYNLISSSIDCLKQIKTLPKLQTTVEQISWFFFIATFIVTMMPAIVKNDFMQSEHMVSWVYGLFIVGIALGSFVYERFSRKGINLMPMFASMWAILILLILTGMVLPFAANKNLLIISLFFLFLLAVVLGVFSTPLYGLVQNLPPKHWQSQAIAANNILNSVYMIAASILQIVLYYFDFSHASMFYVLALCWLLAKRSMFKNYSYEMMYFFVAAISSLRYKVIVKGRQHLPSQGPYIIVSNHVSFIDWAFLGRITKEHIRFVMWYYYYKIPILKILFDASGAIPIAGKKEDINYYHSAFDKMNSALNAGDILLYFPEGGITNDGELTLFRPGLVEVLKRYARPITIIPTHIEGLWGSIFTRYPTRRTYNFFKRRNIIVHLGEPIMADENIDLEKLRQVIIDLK